MKMNKTVKGFTLIELIIVMATFSVIMFGAFQLMDPIGRIFNNAYHQESMSASVDNIKRYVEGNLRYAEYVQITDTQPTDETLKKFIDNYYNGRYYYQKDASDNLGFSLANGDLYVMKIDNANGGKISQWKYTYQAGDLKADPKHLPHPDDLADPTLEEENYRYYFWGPGEVPAIVESKWIPTSKDDIPTTVTAVTGGYQEWAINKAMYDDYHFNISLGMYELVDNQLVWNADYYDLLNDEGDAVVGTFNQDNFSLTITAYDVPTAENPRLPSEENGRFTYDPGYVYSASISLPNISTDEDSYYTYDWEWELVVDGATLKPTGDIISKAKNIEDTEQVKIIDKQKDGSVENPFFCELTRAEDADGNMVDEFVEPNEIYIIYSYPGEDIIKP